MPKKGKGGAQHVRLSDATDALVERLSKKEQRSKTAVVERAVQHYSRCPAQQ